MDRVCFLIESTGTRLSAMLNPETLEITRTTGVTTVPTLRGTQTDTACDDDPVCYGGGGRTELRLNLLFDVALAGSSVPAESVRTLTSPLWQLSENAAEPGAAGRLPLVRFIWGKNWNIPGVITAVAERFDAFNAAGDPQRSWLSMRFRRIAEPPPPPEPAPLTGDQADTMLASLDAQSADVEEHVEMTGASTPGEQDQPARIDLVAAERYPGPSWWRLVAKLSNLDNPQTIPPGTLLRTPPVTSLSNP